MSSYEEKRSRREIIVTQEKNPLTKVELDEENRITVSDLTIDKVHTGAFLLC
ncbi:13102_t:CDS:2 [Ambispora gerdemannii]|uniref:13102_t:CDS:1 n=1 Tax=Ambispora gerdemannii TaxID=144530 RepID=A0A9N9FTV7_9GLOM|nr:13102_t:CDS:2 [Ambispora gerdemannii]